MLCQFVYIKLVVDWTRCNGVWLNNYNHNASSVALSLFFSVPCLSISIFLAFLCRLPFHLCFPSSSPFHFSLPFSVPCLCISVFLPPDYSPFPSTPISLFSPLPPSLLLFSSFSPLFNPPPQYPSINIEIHAKKKAKEEETEEKKKLEGERRRWRQLLIELCISWWVLLLLPHSVLKFL